MKIKVQPSGKNLQKHTTSSKITRFIRLLSNVYILPIEYKNDFKEVKFSLISLRTLISFMVTSIPFFFAMIWIFVFGKDFMSQFFEKSLNVYYLFDFAQMFALNLPLMQPFSNFPTSLWVCKIWTSFPELAQVNKRKSIFGSVCHRKLSLETDRLHTCLPNRNDVFWIGQKVRPIFFNSGQPIGSGDMCPQIKSIYFLVLLPKNWVKKA